ncbi:hypothetical protein SDJN03_08931, partial [Cucurbita argyrosperma subsp. sororia]
MRALLVITTLIQKMCIDDGEFSVDVVCSLFDDNQFGLVIPLLKLLLWSHHLVVLFGLLGFWCQVSLGWLEVAFDTLWLVGALSAFQWLAPPLFGAFSLEVLALFIGYVALLLSTLIDKFLKQLFDLRSSFLKCNIAFEFLPFSTPW